MLVKGGPGNMDIYLHFLSFLTTEMAIFVADALALTIL